MPLLSVSPAPLVVPLVVLLMTLLATLLAVSGTLAEERFEMRTAPLPTTALPSPPAGSVTVCALLCALEPACAALGWEQGCRLYGEDGEVPQDGRLVQLYRRVTVAGEVIPAGEAAGEQTTAVVPATGSETGMTTSSMMATETTEGSTTDEGTPSVALIAETTGAAAADVTSTPAAALSGTPSLSSTTSAHVTLSPSTTSSSTFDFTSASASSPTPTSTPSPASTSTSPATTSSSSGTVVEDRLYWHAFSPVPLTYDESRLYCAAQRPGGDLAGLHSQKQLDFLWQDPDRPDAREWLGIYVGDFGLIFNPTGSQVPFTMQATIEGSDDRFALPAGRITGVLKKVDPSWVTPRLMLHNMVCDVAV